MEGSREVLLEGIARAYIHGESSFFFFLGLKYMVCL